MQSHGTNKNVANVPFLGSPHTNRMRQVLLHRAQGSSRVPLQGEPYMYIFISLRSSVFLLLVLSLSLSFFLPLLLSLNPPFFFLTLFVPLSLSLYISLSSHSLFLPMLLSLDHPLFLSFCLSVRLSMPLSVSFTVSLLPPYRHLFHNFTVILSTPLNASQSQPLLPAVPGSVSSPLLCLHTIFSFLVLFINSLRFLPSCLLTVSSFKTS